MAPSISVGPGWRCRRCQNAQALHDRRDLGASYRIPQRNCHDPVQGRQRRSSSTAATATVPILQGGRERERGYVGRWETSRMRTIALPRHRRQGTIFFVSLAQYDGLLQRHNNTLGRPCSSAASVVLVSDATGGPLGTLPSDFSSRIRRPATDNGLRVRVTSTGGHPGQRFPRRQWMASPATTRRDAAATAACCAQ